MGFNANDVPYEVWLYIAQFIPENELLDLYPVNRALFNICMDMHYKSVRIQGLKSRSTMRCLSLLQDTTLAQRVRHLHLQPAQLGELLSKEKQSKGTLRNRFSLLSLVNKSPVVEEHHEGEASPQEAIQTLLRIIRSMKNVTSLDIHCTPKEDLASFKLCTPFLVAAWRGFGSKLRSLTLCFPLEAMHLMIPQSVQLPNLEELTLDMIPASSVTEPRMIVSHVVPFVNNHSQKLRSLSIRMDRYINLSPFYNELDHMPNISKMTLSSPLVHPQATYITGLRRFIGMHTATLTEMSITYHLGISRTHPVRGMSKTWFMSPFINLTLPNLKSIELGLFDFPSTVTPWAIEHLGPLRNCLTSLTLKSYLVTDEQIHSFLESFDDAPRLRRLELYLDCLRPQIFSSLADKFMFLEELTLHIRSMRGFEGEGSLSRLDSGIPEFCRDMVTFHFPEWKLHELYVDISGKYTEELRSSFIKALAISLPNVVTLNGWPRTVIVTTKSLKS